MEKLKAGASGYNAFWLPLIFLLAAAGGRAQTAECPHGALVRLEEAVPGVLVDLRYAGERNITGRAIYPSGTAWIRPETARALRGVQAELRRHGLQLVVWDAWRPPWAQEELWKKAPAGYVADPKSYSRHSRGTTVDVGLADLQGRPAAMPSGHDEFTARADHDFRDVPGEARRNAEWLRAAMFRAGFSGVPLEWWHYDLRHWRDYPVLGAGKDRTTPKGKR
jgi:zinc D-Ala-D-Ala dipeptidase